MRENGITPSVIRAGMANLFLSDVFLDAFVNATNTPVELYKSDGSVGAALGAGIGANIFANEKDAFSNTTALQLIQPNAAQPYNDIYLDWKATLEKQLG